MSNRLIRFSGQIEKVCVRDTVTQMYGLPGDYPHRFMRQIEWDDGSHETFSSDAMGNRINAPAEELTQ